MKQREKLAKIMLAGFVMATGVSLFSNTTAHAGDFMLSASVSTFCNETMGGVGATWKLKRKSTENPESMENAKDA